MTDILKDIQEAKTITLKELIGEINTLVSERQHLSKTLLDEIEKISMAVNSVLVNARAVQPTPEHLKLEQKKIELEELKLQEKLNCWRDIALLKRELREASKEFRGAESRSQLIDSLLEK
ncbi:hypothetical protein GOV04_02230 [Candidatus Woesearchaeota archaeon]|nr:hypothetical protein [Candidatus Woesearchaeota archaeon]